MKKFLCCVLTSVYIFSVCGCSSDNNKLQETTVAETTAIATTVEVTTEAPTTVAPTTAVPTTIQPTTEKFTEPLTEKTTDVTDTYLKIYSDENVDVYFSGTDSRFSGNYIQFLIKNKTDNTYKFLGETITLDGICYNDITCVGEISSKSQGLIDCHVSGWKLVSPTSIGLHMVYYIDTNNIGDMNTIHIQVTDVKI